jgi:diamine N-acetyltransferase
LRTQQQRHIVLWGGVQAANEKALNFYKKQGYQQMGDFWLNGLQNLDMIKTLY